MTPLEGLVMGTRSGDLDPALHAHLQRQLGWSLDQIDPASTASPACGLIGFNDFRELDRLVEAGDAAASSRSTSTATGCASTSAPTTPRSAGGRHRVHRRCRRALPRGAGRSSQGLDRLDRGRPGRNRPTSRPAGLADGGDVAVLVVPTNEEWQIAREALAIVRGSGAVQAED